MTHVLDNPIWNALCTGNKQLALGTEPVKYIKRDVGLFAGMQTNSEKELNILHTLIPENNGVALFVTEEIAIPSSWQVQLKRDILQMVYEKQETLAIDKSELKPLHNEHVPAMLELTAMTNPGPFLSHTIELGNYEGIFDRNRLIAMAGQRLQPDPYTEVSAVCTHPDYTGKGFAAKLIQSQLEKIQAVKRIPFLHVYPDNTNALKLYEKLGFETRKQMIVYFLKKAT